MNPTVITFKVDKWWLIFTETKVLFSPPEIFFKQDFCLNKLLNCAYGMKCIPKLFWSGSVNNDRISYEHSQVYSCTFITQRTKGFYKLWLRQKLSCLVNKDGWILTLNLMFSHHLCNYKLSISVITNYYLCSTTVYMNARI